MSKKLKKWMADEVRGSVGAAGSCVVVGYKTLSGETSTALRAHLRKSKVEFTVVRNRVTGHALAESALQGIRPLIKGPTAVATGGGDAVVLAKAVMEGMKGRPGFECRGGFIEGRMVTGDEVKTLSTLPGKLELLSLIASAVSQPITGIAFGVDAILTGVVRAVAAVQEKVEKEVPAPVAPAAGGAPA